MPQSDKHFDFAFSGVKFPKQGGSTSIGGGFPDILLISFVSIKRVLFPRRYTAACPGVFSGPGAPVREHPGQEHQPGQHRTGRAGDFLPGLCSVFRLPPGYPRISHQPDCLRGILCRKSQSPCNGRTVFEGLTHHGDVGVGIGTGRRSQVHDARIAG